jgi:hypothetical protein
MIDMSGVIIAKSDQINAPDLIDKPRTIKIAGVKLTGQEQATEIKIVGEDKVWRPCKSMVRVMARAWGIDGEKWLGQSATLYCDPAVKFGKVQPGGIRISHLTGIRGTLTVCLQARKGVLVNYEIEPLTERAAPVETPTEDKEAATRKWCAATLALIDNTDTRPDLAELQAKRAAGLAKVRDVLPDLATQIDAAFAAKLAFLDGLDAGSEYGEAE